MKIKDKLVIICVVFTVLTVLSSVCNFILGVSTDTHLHIIERFILCVIAIGSLVIFDLLKDRPILATVIHYVGTLILIFIFVWSTSFFDPLSPNAYRDVFINYSGVYIVFIIFDFIKKKRRNKKRSTKVKTISKIEN